MFHGAREFSQSQLLTSRRLNKPLPKGVGSLFLGFRDNLGDFFPKTIM
jgi:hypothetical protein